MTLEEFKETNKSNPSFCISVQSNINKIVLALNKIKTYDENGAVEILSVPDMMDILSKSEMADDESGYAKVYYEYFDQINESMYSSDFRRAVFSCFNSFSRTIRIINSCGIQLSPNDYKKIFIEGGVED